MIRHERLQRRRDRQEVDVGDKSINAGVDAGRFGAVHEAAARDQIGEHLQISQSARERQALRAMAMTD